MSNPLRIANCSGFYGDRLSAAREMVEGGPIDVLTGDYLAELTLMILDKDRRRDPALGYARTFLRQLEPLAKACLDRGIRIVVNAGGLNPAGLAEAVERVYAQLRVDAVVAYIDGDDLLPRLAPLQAGGEALAHMDHGQPLSSLPYEVRTANAYLGGAGIAQALAHGADVVICPRVTDAALTLGPAMWHFDWARDDWDRLAGGVVAGHVIECGTQCTGGNYAFFREVPALRRPGFPIAEIHEDGSFVVTKHPDTDGCVSVGTVTAQLLYEVAGPRYENPDVTARFDTVEVTQEGPDRVCVRGARGEPPPPTLKVCINHAGGYKNHVTFLLTGLEIEAKARALEDAFWPLVGGRESFQETARTLTRGASGDDERIALLDLAARDPEEQRVGRRFFDATMEMGLANIPGFHLQHASRTASEVAVYWPALVSADAVDERVHVGGRTLTIAPPPRPRDFTPAPSPAPPAGAVPGGPTRDVPLGAVYGARSGDKGGDANLGLWARSEAAYLWLDANLTPQRLRELLPEARALEIRRFAFPRLLALNFVIVGLLGQGVAASLRTDPQAKTLAEELRAAVVPMPAVLLEPEGR